MTLKPTSKQILIAEHYGANAQELQTIEEMSELTKAILKRRRATQSPSGWDFKTVRHDIVEEIADVANMVSQLIHIYGCELEVEDILEQKIERTLFRINYEASKK